MKKFLRWLAVALVVLVALGVAAWWKRDLFLKAAVVRAIQRRTGLRVEIGTFQSAPEGAGMMMRDFRLYNHPEFGGGLLLDMPELIVELDRELVAAGRVRFKQLRMTLAELNVMQDAAGRWNFEKIENEMTERNAARARRAQPRLTFAGIDELSLSLARIRYTDSRRPDKNRDLRVAVTNETASGIRTEEQLQEWVGSFLFRVIMQEVSNPTDPPRRRHKAKDALKDALDRSP